MIFRIFINAISQSSGLLLTFILLSVSNRYLGEAGRGVFSAVDAWALVFVSVSFLSLPISVVNMLQKKQTSYPQVISSGLFLSVVLGIFSGIGCYILFTFFPKWFGSIGIESIFIIILLIPVIMLSSMLQAVLQMNKTKFWYSYSFYGFQLLHLCFALLAILLYHYDITTALELLLLSKTLHLVVMITVISKKFGIVNKVNFDVVLELLRVGLRAHLSTVVTILANRLDLLMINAISGSSSAGVYFISYSIMSMLLIVPNAIRNIMYQKLAVAESDTLQATVFMTKISFYLMVFLVLGLLLVSELVLKIIGGDGFQGAREIMFLLAPGFIFLSIPMVLVTLWHTENEFTTVNRISLISFFFVFVFNLALIPIYGAIGAALSTSFVFFLGAMTHILVLSKHYRCNAFKLIFMITGDEISVLKKQFTE